MVRPAVLPLRVLSHGRPLLPSRAVASAVTAAVPTAITVTLNANLGPVVTVAIPKGAGVPRTTPHVHSDWPNQMHHAVHI